MTTASPEQLDVAFTGRRGRLLGMALWFGLKTILTLGFYRFWMKTRLRRWFWNSVEIGGVPLEYTGTALEKLLGFCVAVVVLAFWLGLMNLLLVFAALSLAWPLEVISFISLGALVPLWFVAVYRARRYILARTRWRGIRFGLEPGAAGYAWRAMALWAVVILTLGLLWPLKTFVLERYKTDRTWFGDRRFRQEGRWTMLIVPFLPLYLLWIAVAAAVAMAASAIGDANLAAMVAGDLDRVPLSEITTVAAASAGFFLGALVWLLVGMAIYRAGSVRRLLAARKLGAAGFEARPNGLRVAWIYLWGAVLAFFSLTLVFLAIGIVASIALAPILAGGGVVTFEDVPEWLLIAIGVLSYFAGFLLWSAMQQAFITFPLWRHFARTMTITGAGSLDAIRQRAAGEADEAEGIAEALDVGAAI